MKNTCRYLYQILDFNLSEMLVNNSQHVINFTANLFDFFDGQVNWTIWSENEVVWNEF